MNCYPQKLRIFYLCLAKNADKENLTCLPLRLKCSKNEKSNCSSKSEYNLKQTCLISCIEIAPYKTMNGLANYFSFSTSCCRIQRGESLKIVGTMTLRRGLLSS